MDREDRFWFWLWTVLGTLATIILVTITITIYSYDLKMAELGYHQVTVVGYDYPVWKKGE
jgi:hypothetical protein